MKREIERWRESGRTGGKGREERQGMEGERM